MESSWETLLEDISLGLNKVCDCEVCEESCKCKHCNRIKKYEGNDVSGKQPKERDSSI